MWAQLFALLAFMQASVLAVDCTNGAVVFAVRGSDTNHTTLDTDPDYDVLPPGMTATADAVISKSGSGYISAVPYPAISPSTGNYLKSVAIGINATQAAVTQYVDSCGTGKVFLLGYSQGAEVVTSALGGTTTIPGVSPLSIKYRMRISGVSVFADPTFINQIKPLDSGNATTNAVNGSVPGGSVTYAFLKQHIPRRLRSFCQSGDQFCNSGTGASAATAHAIHLAAPQTFQSNATTFLVDLV